MPPDDLPLRDIHLPAPIGLWPLAPGWWALIFLGLGVLLLGGFLVLRKRRMTPEKAALLALDQLMADERLPLAEKSRGISMLLKQLALTTHARARVAALSGPAWIDWLDQRQSQGPLSAELRALLEETPYARPRVLDTGDSASLQRELQTLIRALAKPERRGPKGRLASLRRKTQDAAAS